MKRRIVKIGMLVWCLAAGYAVLGIPCYNYCGATAILCSTKTCAAQPPPGFDACTAVGPDAWVSVMTRCATTGWDKIRTNSCAYWYLCANGAGQSTWVTCALTADFNRNGTNYYSPDLPYDCHQ
jgi:hypothetical protein